MDLLELMQETGADHTMTFRGLSQPLFQLGLQELVTGTRTTNSADHAEVFAGVGAEWAVQDMAQRSPSDFRAWVLLYAEALATSATLAMAPTDAAIQRSERMLAQNPRYVLRNYMAETAIRLASKQDYSEIHRLQRVLSNPFCKQEEGERYSSRPPPWAATLSVSCSS